MSIEAMKRLVAAIDALPEGLEGHFDDAFAEALDKAHQAIAEAEKQEPVAWRNAALRVGEDLCSVGPFGYYDMTAEQWLEWALSVVTVHAPPPPRQPLTDEQILHRVDTHVGGPSPSYPLDNSDWIDFARAIEAAHGIKGDA